MVSSEPLSKGATGAPPEGNPQDTYRAALNALPPSLPPSKAPSIPENPPNMSGSIVSERCIASSDGRNLVEENDVVIAVMGPTGAGKSSFVNIAAGREDVTIGNDLTSQTRTVQPVRCLHPDGRRNIVLVDTPGFDDTHLSDVQVLTIIANWLKETYQRNIKLSGLFYFHRISDVRISGSPLRSLSVLRDLCGETNLKNVVLVTTMWDELDDESIGSKREEDLLTNFWKDMIRLGSQSCRFRRTHESAWDIVEHLDLERPRRPSLAPLQIQEEMVDRGLRIHDTAAAKTLLGSLVGEVKRFWGRIRTGARRITGMRKPSGGLRHQTFPSRSSTYMSTCSESGFRSSPTDISGSFSDYSGVMSSTSSGCSLQGHRITLVSTIADLTVARQANIPILREGIEVTLHVAHQIEASTPEMGGTHHAIRQVIEQSGWLLKEIAQYATQRELHTDVMKTLKALNKELENVQKAVIKISRRNSNIRFSLYDADLQAITECTVSINAVYAEIEEKLAIDNRQAVARLMDQLKELHKDSKLRQCRCRISVVHEESQENEESPAEATNSQDP